MIAKLNEYKNSEDHLIASHRDLFETYHQTKGAKELADSEVARLSSRLTAIENALDKDARVVDAIDDPTERRIRRAEHQIQSAEKRAASQEIRGQLRKAEHRAHKAAYALNQASAAWQPYRIDHERIVQRLQSIQDTHDTLQRMAEDSFLALEKRLTQYESVPVAYASAAYSIYGQEVGAVRELAASLPALTRFSLSLIQFC